MRPEGAREWAAERALGRPVPLLTRPRLCLPPVQRWPIHPDNALTTHLAAVRRETHQSNHMISGQSDSVDQTVARSLEDVIENQWRSCVSHTQAAFSKGSLKRLFARIELVYWEDLNHYHFQFRFQVIEPHIPQMGSICPWPVPL